MTDQNSLYSHFRPFLKRFLLALLFMAMVAVFTAFFAVIIQPVIDELFIQGGGRLAEKSKFIRNLIMSVLHVGEDKMVLVLPQLLFVAFLGQAIFSFLSLYSMKTLGLKVVRNIRDKLYRNLIHQSIDFLSKARTGDLVSRISNDIEKIKLAVAETLAVYIRESLTLVGLLAVVFFQDWKMATLSLVLLPVAAVPLVYFGRKVKKRGIRSPGNHRRPGQLHERIGHGQQDRQSVQHGGIRDQPLPPSQPEAFPHQRQDRPGLFAGGPGHGHHRRPSGGRPFYHGHAPHFKRDAFTRAVHFLPDRAVPDVQPDQTALPGRQRLPAGQGRL